MRFKSSLVGLPNEPTESHRYGNSIIYAGFNFPFGMEFPVGAKKKTLEITAKCATY